jgi:hypothetical protein
LPIVFGDHDAGYKSLEEAEAVLGELMALYSVLNDEVREDRDPYRPTASFARRPLQTSRATRWLPNGHADSCAAINDSRNPGR